MITTQCAHIFLRNHICSFVCVCVCVSTPPRYFVIICMYTIVSACERMTMYLFVLCVLSPTSPLSLMGPLGGTFCTSATCFVSEFVETEAMKGPACHSLFIWHGEKL